MLPDIKVDLHIHTTASDGTWSPERIIENLKKEDIRLFAVTDHDTTENVSITEKLAETEGISFVKGVEISSSSNKRTYHILALDIDPSHSELQRLLDRNTKLMEDNNSAGIRYLAGKYPQVSYEEYSCYRNDRNRGGWKSLNYLTDKGLCSGHRSFFTLFKDWKDSFSKVAFETPADVINTIHASGGVSILAHPGSNMYGDNLQNTLTMMLDFGIEGLECFHPENSHEATHTCLSFCNEHNLFITGGSDCHGDFVGSRKLGHPPVRLSQLRLPF
jgi:predicted metal-dependent phosphoesterase TrpH